VFEERDRYVVVGRRRQKARLMPLKTVVLSACDTAQGGLDYSEGIFGHSTQPSTAFHLRG
jgi:CHAT domain-containing protein